MSNNKLSIIAVNVNSIITHQKRNELLDLTKKHNPDVVCLSETKLNKNHQMSFKNYKFIRRDRADACSGRWNRSAGEGRSGL